jgi:hypothetical protein
MNQGREKLMRLMTACALVLVALAFLLTEAASAGDVRTRETVRSGLRLAAPKDCTPYNGRFGYYGNPWCTAAEQRAWEIHTARRFLGSARN